MWCAFVLIALVGISLSSTIRAISPAPDGGYPGGNTAEDQAALLNLTTGTFNSAVAFLSVGSNTEGQFNTAVGLGALLANLGDPVQALESQIRPLALGALLDSTTGDQNTVNGAFKKPNNSRGNIM